MLTKANQKQIERALSTRNADYVGRTLAILHRGASERQQKEISAWIDKYSDWREFAWVNNTLLHKTEV